MDVFIVDFQLTRHHLFAMESYYLFFKFSITRVLFYQATRNQSVIDDTHLYLNLSVIFRIRGSQKSKKIDPKK